MELALLSCGYDEGYLTMCDGVEIEREYNRVILEIGG